MENNANNKFHLRLDRISCLLGTGFPYTFVPEFRRSRNMDNNSIKDNLQRLRKQKKLTQEEMAARLDISLTAYRDIERGNTSIINNKVLKIPELLDTSIEEIVLGYEPSPADSETLKETRYEYSRRTEMLEKRISDLEKLVDSCEEIIRSKNEIIDMLKRRIEELQQSQTYRTINHSGECPDTE